MTSRTSRRRASSIRRSTRRNARQLSIEFLESRNLLTVLAASASAVTTPADDDLITVESRTHEFRGWVGASDPQDRYRFELAEPARVNLALDELDADLDLYLYDAQGMLVAKSTRSLDQAESISKTLDEGRYLILVTPWRTAAGAYRLAIAADAMPPDQAGDDLTSARALGSAAVGGTVSDTVGGYDPRDVYRLDTRPGDSLELDLSVTTGDLDLFLLDEAGRVVARSWNSGQENEHIRYTALGTTQFVMVRPYGDAEGRYALTYSASSLPETDRADPVADEGEPLEWYVNLVGAPAAWLHGQVGMGVTVAIVDSGIDLDHPELVSQLWVNTDEIAGNGIDDDRNGHIDDRSGWDFAYGDNRPDDVNGHGTHVAGIVAASRDGQGTTGIAYGARIMPVQVVRDDGTGSSRAVADGIRYAVDNGADIINLSLGGSSSSSILAAVQYAAEFGVLVVAAAGNSSGPIPTYPAGYSALLSNVISVGAMSATGTAAAFSNRVGTSLAVQLDAPGVDILSTSPGGGYRTMSGTSMATPHVSGVAALILSAAGELTAARLRTLLVAGATSPAAGSDSAGRIDTQGSLSIAAGAGQPSAGVSDTTVATSHEPSHEVVASSVPQSIRGIPRQSGFTPLPFASSHSADPTGSHIDLRAGRSDSPLRRPAGRPKAHIAVQATRRIFASSSHAIDALDRVLESGMWDHPCLRTSGNDSSPT